MWKLRRTPRIEAKPGTRLDLTSEGQVIACLVLTRITHDRHGTSAEFEDYFVWRDRGEVR
jgi:hypothetical protein